MKTLPEKSFQFIAPSGLEPVRIDVFLAGRELGISRSLIQKLLAAGKVTLNGRPAKNSDKIQAGGECLIQIAEDILHPPTHLTPTPMDLDIIYEDDQILAVNKPAGITVHPGAGQSQSTLVHGLLAHSHRLSDEGGGNRPGIVHRLDKGTSGVMLVAKTNQAHAALSRQFAERKVQKEYWVLAWGVLDEKEITVDQPLGRQRSNRTKMAVTRMGRPAETLFRQSEDHGFCCQMQAYPKTGRTHQIRIHLGHIHHPVVGDPEYGGAKKKLGQFSPLYRQEAERLMRVVKRQMLHARRIAFCHPASGQEMTLVAKFPKDIMDAVKLIHQFD